jgi:hypothetical protein
LNYLIDENDSNNLCAICVVNPIKTTMDYSPSWKSVGIRNIYNQPYFWNFYNAFKRIKIEEARMRMCNYVFLDIINNKGLNQSTIDFFRNKTIDFSEMYLWVQKALSAKISEAELELSYLPILENNELLLERLLLNIVSNRAHIKENHNIEVFKHFGLDCLLALDNDYEQLISKN